MARDANFFQPKRTLIVGPYSKVTSIVRRAVQPLPASNSAKAFTLYASAQHTAHHATR